MKLTIFSYSMKPKMMAAVVILLSLTAIFHYLFFDHQFKLMEAQAVIMENDHDRLMWKDVESIIDMSIAAARTRATDTAGEIVTDVNDQYSDLSVLEAEFNSGNYHSPKFTEIVVKNLKGKYLYDIQNPRNSMFILSKAGILFDDNVEKIKTTSRDIETEVNMHFNTELAYHALDTLITKKTDALLYYEPNAPEEVPNHFTASYPSRDNIRAVFEKEGIKGLQGYEILVPAYITDDGDVFGTPDIGDNGSVNLNHKLIVVQRFSIYDILQKLHYDESAKESLYQNRRSGMLNIMEFCTLSYMSILILNLIAISFLIIYATNTKQKID